MILETDCAPHACHRHINETIQSLSEQVQSLSSMLDGEGKQQPTRNQFELLVRLGLRSESAADIVTDRSNDANLHCRSPELASHKTPRHEPEPCDVSRTYQASPRSSSAFSMTNAINRR